MSHQRAPVFTKLATLPREPLFYGHVWVDYIELLCLFSDDAEITKADVEAHYRRRKDLGDGPPRDTDEFDTELEGNARADDSFASGDNDDYPDAIGDADAAGSLPDDELTASEKTDKLELRIDTWFRHLPYRVEAFDSAYPFVLSRNHDRLRVKERLTQRQKLYLLFLLSSHLNYFAEHSTTFTSGFEAISLEALKKLLPINAEVHLFGKNAYHPGKYKGNIWSKINSLSTDLCGRVLASKEDFSPHNTGDRGLDLVAWVPFNDGNPNMVIMFGGCACSKDEWVQKQLSSSSEAWSNTVHIGTAPANVSFIPICFRRESGAWHNSNDIHQTILIDRVRLIGLLKNYRLPRGHRLSRALEAVLANRSR